MEQELKTKWIEALRSGNYRQTTGQLQYTIEDVEEGRSDKIGWCCLGVLCDLAGIRHDGFDCLNDENKPIGYDPLESILFPLTPDKLYTLNDLEHFSFNQIADYIDIHL